MSGQPMSLEDGIRTRLEETLGTVLYSDLRAHLERDAVFIVGPALTLIECGVAVAMDDVDRVGRWLADGDLRKPSKGERDEWPRAVGRRWQSVVVQPFVLVQDPLE